MKKCDYDLAGIAVLLRYLVFFISPMLVVGAAEPYVFTDLSGRELEAIIHDYDGKEVGVERVSDGRRFRLSLETLSAKDVKYLEEKYADKQEESEEASLKPGEVLTLDFPELGNMAKGKPAQCQLRVPKNYDPRQPVPLLVWFSGGGGSHLVKSAGGIVDFDAFLVVALPYPNGRFPRLAVEAGADEINKFWEFLNPMVERVIELVPNISEDIRIAGGSSSGGHLVGSALDQKWRGFCDYFTGFILHEGGTSPEMEFSGTRSSHRILVIYGEKSVARKWQSYFNERFEQARGRTSFIEVPGAGHGLNAAGKELIRGWVDENFKPE